MTAYVDADLVIRINEKISGQGVRDRNGLESAVARPWTEFLGQELYSTPSDKAGALFHALASTQTFVDGNKRTAWIASQFLFRALGNELKDIPIASQEAFALCVAAVPNYEAVQAGEWFSAHRLTMADRLDFAVLARDASSSPDGTWEGQGLSVLGYGIRDFPVHIPIFAVFRVLWRGGDVGRQVQYRISVEGSSTIESEVAFDPEGSFIPVPPSGHDHQAGAMPHLKVTGAAVTLFGPGRADLVVHVEDEELFRRPFVIEDFAKNIDVTLR